MQKRSLHFTPGSPFGRAIRVILDEIGLDWQSNEADITDSATDRLKHTPTLQVPTFIEGNLTLWDSQLIAEYLIATYKNREEQPELPPLSAHIFRQKHEWSDKLLFATIQTFGESIVLVSQMRWSGINAEDSNHIALNVERINSLMDWFELQLADNKEGFQAGALSVQDIFCICHLMFITHRPLEIEWDRAKTPKLAALHDRLIRRPSFVKNPIEWWEPVRPDNFFSCPLY